MAIKRIWCWGEELTKTFETFLSGTPLQILEKFAEDANQLKGEFVVMLNIAKPDQADEEEEAKRILTILLEEKVSVKQAAAIAAKLTGGKKNPLYKLALSMQEDE